MSNTLTPNPPAEIDDTLEINLDTLEQWARANATDTTMRFDETAQMASIVLGLFDTDSIGHTV